MKRMFLIVVVNLMAAYTCLAQFDDKFYFPSQDWRGIENLDYTETNFHIDNDTLHTVLFKTTASAKATIIYYHGTGGNISYNTYVAKLLTQEGFQVLMIDFRGYGKSTGKPTHLNIATDAQVIFDKMIVTDDLKDYPIIIYGASIGSQIATKIARDNQDKVSALILNGAMSSFTEMALLSAPESQKEMIATYITSPYAAIDDIWHLTGMPKLFMHSKGDRSVPFAQGKAVYFNAPEPKVFWEFEGGHLEASSKCQSVYIQKINALFNEM